MYEAYVNVERVTGDECYEFTVTVKADTVDDLNRQIAAHVSVFGDRFARVPAASKGGIALCAGTGLADPGPDDLLVTIPPPPD